VRKRLLGLVLVAAIAFAAVAAVEATSSSSVGGVAEYQNRIMVLQQQYMRSDTSLAKLHHLVHEIVTQPAKGSKRKDQLAEYTARRHEFDGLVVATLRDVPDGPLLGTARTVASRGRSVLAVADATVRAAKTSPTDMAILTVLDAQAEAMDEPLDAQIVKLDEVQKAAIADTQAAREKALRAVEVTSAVGVLVLLVLALLAASSILTGLRGVNRAAGRLAEGDFDARFEDDRGDEIGALGEAFNATASSLREMMQRLDRQSRRDDFGRHLNEAFEMADTVDQTYYVVGRSFPMISAVNRMELLVADSSRAHLEVRAVHPDAGAPGCPVESPFGCVAVRRGTTTTFADSRALNACPKLRDRSEGPLSAVCVPVTFMGRAIGVLHTTATVEAVADVEEIARLGTVASAAGARIGTVRSFERTQLQASTDGLTGLMNRRTFETTARPIVSRGGPFAVVMADIDHFKTVNDTLGHAAGDRALALFAQLLRAHLRSEDLLARYGGEEFVMLLADTSIQEAAAILDRFRARLAEVTNMQPPALTASFGVVGAGSSDSLAGLVRRADAALYRAKEEGRDRVVIDDRGPDVEHHADVSSALERALREDDPLADLMPLL
jgi:diguanylate cyclase (GGDEF)-like protein